MNEHQMRNEINYNTVMSDRCLARVLGLLSWKERRWKSARGAGVGARNPLKTSGRREMRTLLESLRKFTVSPTHPHGNRATRRGHRGNFATYLSPRSLKAWEESVGTGSLL